MAIIIGMTTEASPFPFSGARVRRLREERGWSLYELAFRVRMSESTISRLESGERKNPDTFRQVAKALRVPLKALMEAPQPAKAGK